MTIFVSSIFFETPCICAIMLKAKIIQKIFFDHDIAQNYKKFQNLKKLIQYFTRIKYLVIQSWAHDSKLYPRSLEELIKEPCSTNEKVTSAHTIYKTTNNAKEYLIEYHHISLKASMKFL